jgi:hypothetical protein
MRNVRPAQRPKPAEGRFRLYQWLKNSFARLVTPSSGQTKGILEIITVTQILNAPRRCYSMGQNKLNWAT